MKKKGFAAFLRRKEYVIAGALVVAAAVGTTVVYTNNQEKERQQIEMELAEEQQQQQQELAAAEEKEEPAAEASSVIPPKNTAQQNDSASADRIEEQLTPEGGMAELEKKTDETSTEDVAEENTEGKEQVAEETKQTTETAAVGNELHFSPEEGIDWPLEGNVILNYSMDASVHFVTLDQYKYNPAVIIEGEVNDKVCSVAKGQVLSIENDEVTGCTMTVDLGDGYRAIYGQIKEPNFAVGDYVESGHVLAYIGEPTKYFSVEGSNLYFALEKDGEPVDPVEFFD